MKGGGSYLPANQVGDAKATVTLPNLAPLSDLAGVALAGNSTVDLTVNSDRDGIKLGWRGTVSNVTAEGLPSELITAQVALSGAATWRFDEAWTLSDVRVASEGATFIVAGRGKAATGELDLTVELPKLDFLKAELGGAAKLTSNIRLGADRTDLKLVAELSDLVRGQIASRKLTLSATGSLDAAGAASGEVKASGDLAGQPLSLDGRFSVDAAGGVTVPRFQGRWASVVLDVDDFAVTKGRTSGYARLKADRLADASNLAGTALGGSLDAEITADDRAADGRVTVRVQGSDLRVDTLAIGTLDLRSTIDEPMAAAKVDATLAASRIAGAADINRLNATASGDRQTLTISLQASGAQTAANAAAKVELLGDDLVVGLTRFDGRYGAIPVALAGPTRVHIAGPRITIEPTNLRVGGGRLAVRGTLAPSGSDLQLELAALPLSLIDAFAPGTNLDGTLQAKLRVQGSMDAPLIDGTYNVAGLRVRRPEAALVPPLNVQGSGSLMGRQASIDARLAAAATNLTLKGKATLPRGAAPLSGSAAIGGTMDLAPFAPLLGNDIRNVTGRLRPDLTVEISGSRVTGNGSIDFSNGAVAMPESGLRLSGGEGRLVLQGDTLQVQRLNFQTARGGGVGVTGTMRLDAQQGLVPDLTVTSRNALLVSRPDLVASVSSNIKVTGSTVAGLSVAGPITIDRAEIAVGAEQSASFPTLEVREINKAGGAATAPAVVRPAPAKPPPRAAPPPGAAPVRLALVDPGTAGGVRARPRPRRRDVGPARSRRHAGRADGERRPDDAARRLHPAGAAAHLQPRRRHARQSRPHRPAARFRRQHDGAVDHHQCRDHRHVARAPHCRDLGAVAAAGRGDGAAAVRQARVGLERLRARPGRARAGRAHRPGVRHRHAEPAAHRPRPGPAVGRFRQRRRTRRCRSRPAATWRPASMSARGRAPPAPPAAASCRSTCSSTSRSKAMSAPIPTAASA